ncbi:Aspartokinase I/homoserine dehydrogenase I [Legionella massiliensis]|uniref:Bifunctional aspartokinase/homoserine dehydrogenase n=1 Tax=Legionella massiliensis TaxID=1034943 RepID=A0A078KW55_9GAMM|nr:bifunctional aspartate kinase/homoserine dehydrogenase I [Legionella massiliensis]CDZ75984.1 Aspartokinase I/homoserine dehydrogenase I [Legionella massiliensis]CEE11722.1 Bifunctional aspartokinase/homoserine dehydrogenase 1 [Legionella massiliensis]
MINNHSYSIHKFGGSSLANSKKIKALKSLLKGEQEIIVVSAVQGTTSSLQSVLDLAKSSLAYMQVLEKLEEKHLLLIQELGLDFRSGHLLQMIQNDIFKIKDILYAVYLTGSYSKEIQNYILGYGELWSAKILREYLAKSASVAYLDAADVLFIYEKEGIVCIDWDRSKSALENHLINCSFNQLVVTGFIASTLDGERTILGRNGSDFSAAIFANLFNAKELIIWTDVDGIYSADPSLVRSAFVIESLSYQEALELAYFGAKVLHPMTIAPLVGQRIPLYIKNSYNPQAKGTFISAKAEKSSQLIKGISCIENVALINIEGSGLISVSGIVSRVASILYQAQINVMLISQASSEHSICLAIPAIYLKKALSSLQEHLQADLDRKHLHSISAEKDCAILSAVGEEMIGNVGIAAKLCASLAKANINIAAISQGSSERNISVVIKDADVRKAMQAVHAGFYLSPKSLAIGLIGPGVVGKSLLQQLENAINHSGSSNQMNLQILGIMDSKKMLLSDSGIELNNWQESFQEQAVAADLPSFVEHFSANLASKVIIDCTANKAIAQLYQHFMKKGIHVITPNKHANAEDLAYYKELKALTGFNNHYFYEATVCAGLPVISTLQDLIRTGDEILEVEGVVSGTLSYIFNEMAKGRSFSAVVFEAKSRGYTEPDPREDLSGKDVARKLVCLAREIGYEVSLADVAVHDLIPPELKSCSLKDFLANLSSYDQAMNQWLKRAKDKNQRLHYVGSISQEGKVQVAIKLLAAEHPFARLEGTDNMLIFKTKRYYERPLIIQGPGAGAEVTAAGIFADLLRLVSVLS